VGPSLFGVLGRKAGEIADFRYSPAMRNSNITWSPQTLDEFIADPQKAVPGNRMPFAGMPEAADRADLLAYLQKATK
jgi:cytochrome c